MASNSRTTRVLRRHWPAFALAMAGAVLAAASVHFLFPSGSPNLDETAYRAHALALQGGDLTLPASTHDPAFLPFLSGVRDGRVVFKYEPGWPVVLAASDLVTGSTLPVVVLLGAAAAAGTYWFAWELLRSRGIAAGAGMLFAGSTFVWLQSGTVLGYHYSYVLMAVASAAVLRAARTGSRVAAVAAGAMVGLAMLHRPFDTVVVGAPVAVYALWRAWHTSRAARVIGFGALGAAPFLVLGALYHQAVMGAPWRSPFGISGPLDRFGFGWRASFVVPGTGTEGQVHYTVGTALDTVAEFAAALARVLPAAPLLLFAAGWAVVAHRRRVEVWLLVVMTLVVPAAYFSWWGTANAVDFDLHRLLGPFYWYPVLLPLSVLAAWALAAVRTRRAAKLGVAVMFVLWFLAFSLPLLRDAREAGRIRADELASYDAPGRALVLVTPVFPGDPYVRVENRARLDGDRVVAVDVPAQRLATVTRFPSRGPYLVREYHPFGDPFGATVRDRVPLDVVRGSALAFGSSALAGNEDLLPYLVVGRQPATQGTVGTGHGWVLTAEELAEDETVEVAVGFAPGPLAGERFECRFEVRRVGDELEALAPCDGWHHYVFPDGTDAWAREDLSEVMTVDVESGP